MFNITKSITYILVGLIVAFVITTVLRGGREVRTNKLYVLNQLNDPSVSIIIRDNSELFQKLYKGLPNADLHYIPYGMETVIEVIPVEEKENK